MTLILPPAIAGHFSACGWAVRPHQAALARAGLDGRSALLTAPTGGGKTMAGFLAFRFSRLNLELSDRFFGIHYPTNSDCDLCKA